MIRKLVYSTFLIVVLLMCINCLKKEVKFDNPIFAYFFSELNNKTVDDFIKSYYKGKPEYVLAQYRIPLNQLKDSKSEIVISDYDHNGKKLNIDGNTKDIYIIENDKEIITVVKIEDNKIKYLIPIHKGNELIGWL
ncbi:hypothetical protein ACNFU2_06955 [Chryseobacterium sp. PTM-20240506]|uniref:hypothetical protein n=1 Tax=Chryseobacterium sp. PTM-20240506 TaxID=3400631 RepID=UPI003AAE0E65